MVCLLIPGTIGSTIRVQAATEVAKRLLRSALLYFVECFLGEAQLSTIAVPNYCVCSVSSFYPFEGH